MNLTDESFANTSMQTLEILNLNFDNAIKGFNNNTNLSLLKLQHCTINAFSKNTFSNAGKSGDFRVVLEQSTTVTTLDGFANSNITDLEINGSTVTTINSGAFSNLTTLKSVSVIGNSRIDTIGNEAFKGCTGLTILNIEDSSTVTSIGNDAFRDCDLNTTFNLTNNITTFGNDVFNSTNLRGAIIPANLTSIGTGVYGNCRKNITVDYRGNNRFNLVPAWTFYNNIALRSISIPTSVNTIGESAFKIEEYKEKNNDGIQSINLNNITTLSNNCFQNTALTSYSITSKISHIPDYAFDGCSMMTSIDLNNPRTFTVGIGAFKNTKSLRGNRTNFNNITTIGDSAFEESGINSHPVFSEQIKIQSVGSRAFYHTFNLQFFPFTSSTSYACNTATIANNAFEKSNLSQMGKIRIAGATNGLKKNFNNIGVGAFAYSGIPFVSLDTFEANITRIPNECFRGLGANTEYSIPNSSVYINNRGLLWESIDSYAFEGMSKIKTGSNSDAINLNANNANYEDTNVTWIGENAFANAKSSISCLLIGSVQFYGNQAFYNTDIEMISYNDNNDKTGFGISFGSYAFAHSEEWNKNNADRIRTKGSTSNLGRIIERARAINDHAFYNLAGIPSTGNISTHNPVRKLIVRNDSYYGMLTNIGANTFEYNYIQGDNGSSKLLFPISIKNIKTAAFRNIFISNNTSFITPYLNNEFKSSNVLSISDNAFDNNFFQNHTLNKKNNTLYLPSTLSDIGSHAFNPGFSNYNVALCANKKYSSRNGDTGLAYDFYVAKTGNVNNITLNFNNAQFENNSSGKTLVKNLENNFSKITGKYTFVA